MSSWQPLKTAPKEQDVLVLTANNAFTAKLAPLNKMLSDEQLWCHPGPAELAWWKKLNCTHCTENLGYHYEQLIKVLEGELLAWQPLYKARQPEAPEQELQTTQQKQNVCKGWASIHREVNK